LNEKSYIYTHTQANNKVIDFYNNNLKKKNTTDNFC